MSESSLYVKVSKRNKHIIWCSKRTLTCESKRASIFSPLTYYVDSFSKFLQIEIGSKLDTESKSITYLLGNDSATI